MPELVVISAGGVLGALARWGIALAWPHRPDQFAWATLTANVTGCLLIGVLMVLVNQWWPGRRLLRPFLGTGVLGGYTTFSTYSVDIVGTASAGTARTAVVYLAATLAGAMLAVWTGATAARRIIGNRAGRQG